MSKDLTDDMPWDSCIVTFNFDRPSVKLEEAFNTQDLAYKLPDGWTYLGISPHNASMINFAIQGKVRRKDGLAVEGLLREISLNMSEIKRIQAEDSDLLIPSLVIYNYGSYPAGISIRIHDVNGVNIYAQTALLSRITIEYRDIALAKGESLSINSNGKVQVRVAQVELNTK